MSLVSCPRVIMGGTLIDGTGNPPIEDSVVIINGEWIIAVGKREEINLPKGAEVIDASGKSVLPGFIDAHTHFLSMGIHMIRYLDLSSTSSVPEMMDLVKERLQATAEGEWVLGRGWDDSKLKEQRYITKDDLDPLSSEHPIALTRVCGRLITVNSRALELASINSETADPPGGKIDRRADGELTGVLRDANILIENAIPPITEEVCLEGLKRASDYALSLGCTSVHDTGIDTKGMRIYHTCLNRGILKVRVYTMFLDDASIKGAIDLGLQTGFGNEMLRLGSAKFIVDGSLVARTAALFEPYDDDPETRGLLMMESEELNEKVKIAHKNGLQVAIHAIGDRGIETAINAIDEALREAPRKGHRHRIERSEVLTSNQIERMRELGIVASMQPNFVGEWSGPGGLYEARLGVRRLRQNNPYRLLLDEGVRVAFGSDCMPFNPLFGLWSAINTPIKENRLSLEEAVKSYTLDSAYISFEEDLKGSIEPGKLADITILEGDLKKISEEEIKDISVYMTIVNGKILFKRDQHLLN